MVRKFCIEDLEDADLDVAQNFIACPDNALDWTIIYLSEVSFVVVFVYLQFRSLAPKDIKIQHLFVLLSYAGIT